MPKGLNQICISCPPVAMGGTINVMSTLNVVTKAKLDSIGVSGNCDQCDVEEVEVAPPTPTIHKIQADIVYLVDRSESITKEIWETITTFVSESIQKLSDDSLNETIDAEVNNATVTTDLSFMVRGFGQQPDDERFVEGSVGTDAAKKVKEWDHENKDGTYTHLALKRLCEEDVVLMRPNSAVTAAVVVTDGLSKNSKETAAFALKLKEQVGIVFGVSIEGVSNYSPEEQALMKQEIETISSDGCSLSLNWDNLYATAESEAKRLAKMIREEIVKKAKALSKQG